MNQEFQSDLPPPSWLVIPREQFMVRLGLFAIFSFLIYIVFVLASAILIKIGNAQFAAGNEKLGAASYNLALEFNSDLKRVIHQCYAKNTEQQYELAIEQCNKAIVINKSYANAYFYRGYAYWKLKQYDQAIADFTKDIELITV